MSGGKRTAREQEGSKPKRAKKIVRISDKKPAPSATAGSAQDLEAIAQNVDDIAIANEDAMELTRDSMALIYEGFAPEKVRSSFIGDADVNDDAIAVKKAKDLIKCLMAYASAGNNLRKLTERVTDIDRARGIVASITTAGVKQTASGPGDITLPRLAIAFMSVYLAYRYNARSILQNQTSSTIDVVFKDVAFCGHRGIYNMAGYTEFYQEFSMLIGPPDEEVAAGESKEDFDEHWPLIAQEGYEKDTGMHGLVDSVVRKHSYSMLELVRFAIIVIRKHKVDIDRAVLDDAEEGEVADANMNE